MNKIILASQSPRRKKLFQLLGIDFDVIPSNTDEIITSKNPNRVVKDLSAQKALAVAQHVDDGYIIGADTIVVFKNKILGKPKDEADAFNMLLMLSNKTHTVITGVSVIKKENGLIHSHHSFCEKTKVTFSTLSKKEIRTYILSGSPMDKAGAYGIQDDWGALFVKKIKGDFYNVVGFPLHTFYEKMKLLEPKILMSFSKSI